MTTLHVVAYQALRSMVEWLGEKEPGRHRDDCLMGDGRSVFVDIDPGFGTCRFWLYEMGMDDPDEAGLGPPDVGFWMAHAGAGFSKDYESGHSELDGFSVDMWQSVSPSGTGWKPDEEVR